MKPPRIAEKNNNPLLNCALTACAACYKLDWEEFTEEKLLQLSHTIGSEAVAVFFRAALENLLDSRPWEQAEIWVTVAYEQIDKQALSWEELQTLVILRKLFPRLFWERDFAYLYDMVNDFCNWEVLTMLTTICPEECRKINEKLMNPSEAAAWGVIGE